MYRTVAQLDSVMNILGAFFPDLCTRFEMPHPSVEGRTIFGLHFHAGTAVNRRGVLVIGGMHARELMNPDAIADLQLDLALAYLNGTGLTLGGRSWSALDIKIMLEALDLWLVPCANPDGREFVINVDDLWRKNRRDNPGTTCKGADVNRNCDIVWGVTTSNTSCSPCSITYCGPDRFSEPESSNIRDFCNSHRVDVFLDVHSFSELVLFPWGHAFTQTTDPSENFTTLATGTCLPIDPPDHREYMLPRDQLRFRTVANRIVADIHAVRGRNYTPESVRELYATTGTSCDYVYSRHLADPALRKTYGFSFETGPDTGNDHVSFHPEDPSAIIRDTKAGILSLLQQSICAIEFIGGTLFGTSSALDKARAVRDERLAATKGGRNMIDLFERVQMPLLGLILADESLTKEATSLLETFVRLLDDEKQVVASRDVERGRALLDKLAKRSKSRSLKRDLATVRKQLARSEGKSVAKVLKQLLG